MLLELPGPIPSSFLIKSLARIGRKSSTSSLDQFPYISFWNPYWNSWKVFLEIRGPIPSSFLLKPLLIPYDKSIEDAPGAHWAYSFPLLDINRR